MCAHFSSLNCSESVEMEANFFTKMSRLSRTLLLILLALAILTVFVAMYNEGDKLLCDARIKARHEFGKRVSGMKSKVNDLFAVGENS